MGKIKLNLVSGAIVEKPLINAFKVNNSSYVVLDNEMNGSMGLPIILVCKLENNKLIKIVDQSEWQIVKEYLKNIIAGSQIEFINVGNELQADDIYYTQLTLPVPSFDALKKAYKVTEVAGSPVNSIPTPPEANPTPNQMAGTASIMDLSFSNNGTPVLNTPANPVENSGNMQSNPVNNINSSAAPMPANPLGANPTMPVTPDTPAVNMAQNEIPQPNNSPMGSPAVPPITPEVPSQPEMPMPPLNTVEPVAPAPTPEINPTPVAPAIDINPVSPVMPAAPDVNPTLVPPITPVAPEIPAVPVTPNGVEMNNSSLPNAQPNGDMAPGNIPNPNDITPLSVPPLVDLASPNPPADTNIEPVNASSNMVPPAMPEAPNPNPMVMPTEEIFREQKEAFMQACENMFDALVQKFEKQLENHK